MGLSGRVPSRVDAATKAGLLDLVEQAAAQGWTVRAACRVLELGDLLAERPELTGDAERLANRRLAAADRHAAANNVRWSLGSLELEQLNLHAGYQRGHGYVHPVGAASELLEEALQPYLDDIVRLAGLGLPAAAQEVAAGGLLGLYQYRDQPRRTRSWWRHRTSLSRPQSRSWMLSRRRGQPSRRDRGARARLPSR